MNSARGPFPLLELLERLPGVFSDMVAHLQPRHKASLALTCSVLRAAVGQTAHRLVLHRNRCCLSRLHQLHTQFPNVSQLVLRPGNLHEAMFVAPLLLMQVGMQFAMVKQCATFSLRARKRAHMHACMHVRVLAGTCDGWCHRRHCLHATQDARHMAGITCLELCDLLPDR